MQFDEIALASTAGPGREHGTAHPTLVLELEGLIESAEHLACAVVNGRLVSSSPRPDDLPVPFAATLSISPVRRYARFNLSGSFARPTRSYTFFKTIDNVYAGLDLSAAPVLRIENVFAALDFELTLDLAAGIGSFDWRQAGAVPTSPARDARASGLITAARFVATPGVGRALAALGLAPSALRPRAPAAGVLSPAC